MPNTLPIVISPEIRSSVSSLVELRWRDRALAADFAIRGDDAHVLRVRFEKAEVVRVLDEMPLSTEPEATPSEGLILDRLAYSVEGALFWECQSEVLGMVYPSLRHFRFITGWICLDVLADNDPEFWWWVRPGIERVDGARGSGARPITVWTSRKRQPSDYSR